MCANCDRYLSGIKLLKSEKYTLFLVCFINLYITQVLIHLERKVLESCFITVQPFLLAVAQLRLFLA